MDKEYIREYFHDNEMYDWTLAEEYEFVSRREKYINARMVLAQVNPDWQESARHFFNEYDIPFRTLKSGPNKGKLAVLPVGARERRTQQAARQGLLKITSHA